MIKAVIWDIGGVLVEDPEVKGFWKDKEGSKELRKEFGSNRISVEEFAKRGAELLGMGEEEFLNKYKEAYPNVRPVEEVLEIYNNLESDNYILSDTNPIHMNFIKENFKEMLNKSKKVYFSPETGMRKDDKETFEFVSKDIGLKPEEILFIDNKEELVEVAREAGLNAIQFTAVNKLKKDLEEYSLI